MIGLALDLSANTGWALGDDVSRARAGVWRLGGYVDDRIDRTMAGLYSAVNSTCRENSIDTVIIETALRGLKRTNKRGITTPTSAHGDRCLTMLNGVARAAAMNGGARRIVHLAPNTWRASVLGNGYPKDPKGEAILYCSRVGNPQPDHNAAEALCMLQHILAEAGLLARIKP